MHTSIFLASFFLHAATAQWCAGQPDTPGYCTPQTWTALPTTADSPQTAECQDACRGVASDAGDWGANLTGLPEGQRHTVVGYPCGFSLGRGPGQGDPLEFDFQNQDILDVYQGAIDRFATADGRVAATGTMSCQGKRVQWWVD
ncbi:glycoside hydrolase family 18 protein [Apiospora rasikravindrae]|uniref:Glycoside hydrolase family 18 protein n=1 Tax=Apiospora rasikravindrae TaxID=990691 RepID=A0ABR1SIC5_9PEZI